VVVRVHNGTSDAMLRRHISWAADLASPAAGSAGEPVQTWLLFDETYGGDGAWHRARALIRKAGLGDDCVRCFRYAEDDMLRSFDVLEEMRKAIPDTQNVRDSFTLPCRKSLAWCYHVEAILLWWLHVAGGADDPSSVWVIEDDVGYSGDMFAFVQAYANDPSDLIAHAYQRVDPGWVWCNTASPGFLELAPLAERVRCAEHVQRMSGRLLRALHRHCTQRVSAWSEMSVPTLCRKMLLRAGPLREEHIGAVFTFDGKVPEAVWPRICSEPSTRGKWWHALKW